MIDSTETLESGETVHGRKLSATLQFSKSFYGEVNEKKIVIFRSDKLNYIMYQDNTESNLQDIKYELKPTSIVYDVDPSDNSTTEKKEYNDIRFEYLHPE